MATPVDLLFVGPPLSGQPVDLVFGEVGGAVADTTVVVSGMLPALIGVVRGGSLVQATVIGTLPALTGAVHAHYVSGAARPVVGELITEWEQADPLETGVADHMDPAQPFTFGLNSGWERAVPVGAVTSSGFENSDRSVRPPLNSEFQSALPLTRRHVGVEFQDALRAHRRTVRSRFQKADRLQGRRSVVRHQDAIRELRNWAAARWQSGVAQSVRTDGSSGPALWMIAGWETEFQKAMRPPHGTSPIVVPPEPHYPCYVPPLGDAVHLAFRDPWTESTDLVFVCETNGTNPGAAVVVPIKRVYVVLNTSSLRRVDSNAMLPIFSMSMSLDVDSWTWSFSASLPGAALVDLQPTSPGEPILVEAMVNGVAYRLQVETRGRDRTFASDAVKISGRGLAAILDSPHAPIMNHSNSSSRTAQQLMGDVLTDNGVGIGWDIDWQAVDWSVPAGVFAHQGAYIDALNVIARAAGSYIQPHPTAQTLHVLPRYPILPWDWAATTADYEIPSAVATVEGIEWIDKAVYNRVFVSGVQEGVLGRVTRAGTDGGLVAPMVTDPLITTAAAARQRGTPVLANTGSQANVSVRLPVLAETGIIVPGRMVLYVDGATTHLGITRSVKVDVSAPEIWQTIVLETHVV